MRKIEIGLDMDGVIVDLVPHWVNLVNRYHGEELKPEEVKVWSLHKLCKNATVDQVYGFFKHPGFFRHLDPIPGACETIDALIDSGDFNVSIITTCRYGHRDKIDWLKDHIKNYKKLDIYPLTGGKHRVKTDLFVDDHIGNLEPYKQHNPDSIVVCFDQPHNQEWKGNRAFNWENIKGVAEFLDVWQNVEVMAATGINDPVQVSEKLLEIVPEHKRGKPAFSFITQHFNELAKVDSHD